MSKANPHNSVAWYLEGDKIAILNMSTTSGHFEPIDETAENVVWISFGYKMPTPMEEDEDTPDLPTTLHPLLVTYIKSKLFLERAGKAATNNAELAVVNIQIANTHFREWKTETDRWVQHRVSRLSAAKALVPTSFRR